MSHEWVFRLRDGFDRQQKCDGLRYAAIKISLVGWYPIVYFAHVILYQARMRSVDLNCSLYKFQNVAVVLHK